MTIDIQGLAESRKSPGVYVNTVLGGPGTSAGSGEMRLLTIGNMLTAAITAAAPSFTVAAGTHRSGTTPTAEAVLVRSESHARELFGAGSELHLMCWRALEQYPGAPLYACPAAELGGAARAAGRIYVSGTATAAVTLRLWVAGQRLDYEIASGDAAADIVAGVTSAILAVTTLPVTAQYAAGPVSPVTVTAKQAGTRGNLITLRGNILYNGATYDIPANVDSTTPPTTVVTVAGVTLAFYAMAANATSTAKYLAGGTGTDSAELATVLTAVARGQWHRIAVAHVDNAASNDSLDRLSTWLTSQSGPTKGIRMQAIAAQVATLASSLGASTPSGRTNNPLIQLVHHPRAEHTPGEIAAQTAAARLIGDGEAGGATIGEASDVAANLDGCRLVSITVQPYDGDRYDADDPDTALQYGLTPLVASSRAGYVEIGRSITSRWYDATSAPNYGVLDTSDVSVTHYVVDDIVREHAQEFKGYKLAPDGDTPPKTSRTTTPTLVRAWIHARLKTHEERGRVVEVDARANLLRVIPHPGSAWRLDAEIPIVPIPGYHILAANARQLSAKLT